MRILDDGNFRFITSSFSFQSTAGTYPIKGIHIRTSKDRKTLNYIRENLSCTGNEIKFSMNIKESKPSGEISCNQKQFIIKICGQKNCIPRVFTLNKIKTR